ncbi:hypothetical protein FJ959_22175 [Mesorhizobium sp. B2-2-4]|uniref:hypothetical protein n=1 Tax=unclassified Mesorhizobium TaxID=325217 RepID=UPI001126DA22|nr:MULTISPECIES: hypothetical protein [unclassified Mesorhizobium]TPM53241.1 hypothetical protein FJ959_22175 [Mesorhizobium sp. B2-2-4]TPM62117.1 hypothetical protein FJ965_21195 [Mesorhizobium sp. B2-2-1]TPN68488.1 hypothetical protein FJ984_11675 [Mesorhizobium sp. B1-1-3]
MNAALHPAPVAAHVFDERLGNTWRHNLSAVRDDLLMIRQHQKTIAEADEMLTPTVRLHSVGYVEHARKLLPWRLSLYLEHVKAVSLAEAKMDAIGMEYAASSDDWRA